MAKKQEKLIEKEDLVIKFVGDSGDGMQLIGTLFSDTSAIEGNDLATFPDFPAEIRAPHNTVAGVSGFQVHIGKNQVRTIGDLCDVLVAMNPASLKANLKWAKIGATIILDSDTFDEKSFDKAGYKTNPLEDSSLSKFNIVAVPITTLTRESILSLNLEAKLAERSKNMFALGMIYYVFSKSIDIALANLEQKFKKKPQVFEINKTVIKAGYHYAETSELLESRYYVPAAKMEKGKYRNISGNIATAWGLLAAAERSGRPLFLGSYPITPATDILIELAKHKSLGAKVFQAEDEIAGICSAIGASYTGSLAITSTSGPGLSLKSEAIGLAVMTELPLVIINVQRGGPSTGLPTKSEQSDLYQALFGRNGECPVIVLSASSPVDCFYKAYEAAKLAMEHMHPVILLTDGNIGNGSELFKIPKVASLPSITPPIAKPSDGPLMPYLRNAETLVRKWAIPGTENLRHRVGGLEKENIIGTVSTDPVNHEMMINLREQKIQRVANNLPEQVIKGNKKGDLLVVSWGSTEGSIAIVIEAMQKEGKKISHAHFSYIMPLPKNSEEVFKGFKNILVCELNNGQFVNYLRMKLPQYQYKQYNKVQCLPFTFNELSEVFNKIMEGK